MKRANIFKEKEHAVCATRYTLRNRGGQVLIITVLVLGGVILAATTIGGLLLLYQIRQSTDLASSAKAIYAADAGIEWGLYQFYQQGGGSPRRTFSNGAVSETRCYRDLELRQGVGCNATGTAAIVGTGEAGGVKRAFLLQL